MMMGPGPHIDSVNVEIIWPYFVTISVQVFGLPVSTLTV